MRQVQGISVALAGMVLAAQPSLAATTQVTGVQLNEQGNELKLVLETQAGAAKPQVQTVKNGNELIAELANTKLNLQSGESFRQENPLPGIKALVVSQLDDNKVRVTVSGEKTAPNGLLQENAQGISLGISTEDKLATEANSTTTDANLLSKALFEKTPSLSTLKAATSADKAIAPVAPIAKLEAPTTLAQVPQPAPQRQIPTVQGQVPTITTPVPTVVPPPAIPAPSPDVMVPNPRITIDGIPAPATGAAQPVVGAPPFLPRAVAPPVGDIAISNINASASYIDLGTGVRVPRLVLREAPVREVLSLLARSAGLNIAYIGEGAAGGAPGGAPGGPPGAQKTISLDLENEPVQNVFNFVLQVSGLQANRVGNTILVGSQLPDNARNLISRTIRVNQVTALEAANFLISQGAEQQQLVTSTTITVVGEGPAAQRIQNTSTTVQRLAPQDPTATGGQAAQGGSIQNGALVLRGLLVSSDLRLNAITLVGEPRKVEVATALLTQLDLRRRQVAVNVKIVDINLLGTDAFNASFSFGIGNGFFAIDNGTAVFNYGGIRPPTAAQAGLGGSTVSPPVINNPFAGSTVFLDPNNTVTIPGTAPGTTIIDSRTGQVTIGQQGSATFFSPFVNLTNPLQAGFTNITQPTNNTVTINADGTTTATAGTNSTVTTGLPSVFQFPKRLLAALQAQVTSGNAKILTDPTIVVQEGQTATINLTQEVFGGIRIATQTDPTTNLTTQSREPIIKNAGLILQVNVQRIDDNGFITLTANPIVSSIGTQTNTTDGTIGLIQQRQLQSGQIRLRDGQTLILSGIIQESDRTTVSKVPILGDIPLLGALFRSTSREKGRNEVIVLLTPQILDDSQNASFGYNYTPGRDARQLLQQSGAPAGNN
ncbi:MAG: AMIN domain-containing protein [Coleofasciculaceae cyanobacterium]